MAGRKRRRKGRARNGRGSKDFLDYELMKVLAKPQRVRILTILLERTASPKEISEEIGEALGSVSYHVRVLLDHDMIKLERKERRRGAVEHFYRGVSRTLLPTDAWANLPSTLKKEVSACIVQEFLDDAAEAMEAGVFDDPAGDLSWTPLLLDRLGVEKIGQLAAEFLKGVLETQAQATVRLAASQGAEEAPEQISATVFLASFLSSRDPEDDKKASATLRR